jgi:hypothetical protein
MNYMKKTLIVFVVLLFSVVEISYAGIYTSQTNQEKTFSPYNSLYGPPAGNTIIPSDTSSGLFKAPENGFGGRPGNGEGIGQEAPIDDGLAILLVCCGVLVIIRAYIRKREKNLLSIIDEIKVR